RRPHRERGRVHAQSAGRAGSDPRVHAAIDGIGHDRSPAPGRMQLTVTYAAELAFALDLAARAGVVLMDHYERLEQIDYKSARDVVTEADHLSDALILDVFRASCPADAILAEETGEHKAKAGEAPTSGRGRVWIIDPLDGTVNYANGIPVFCVSIARVAAGRPYVGVVHDPTRGETFAATAGGPAMLMSTLGTESFA